MAGGEVASTENGSEDGKTGLSVKQQALFEGVPEKSVCWMSHIDYIKTVPMEYQFLAAIERCPCAALGNVRKKLYGIQFRPEVTHTEFGKQILHDFLFSICGCKGDWNA